MTRLRSKQEGVVLLVVLSILATIGLLLLQVALRSREEVAKAQMLLDRTEAMARLRTEQARLELALLTNQWVAGNSSSLDARAQRWSFDGTPFEVDGTEIRIQDEGGLFVMPRPGYNASLATVPTLLSNLGIDRVRAAITIDRLTERIKPPQQIALQELGELMGAEGLTRAELERLRAVTTLYPVQRFNFVTAPKIVLESAYAGSSRDAMLALRSNGGLNPTNVSKVIGDVDPDLVAFFAGPVFRVTLRAKVGSVTLAKESIIEVDPYLPEPIKTLSTRRPTLMLSEAP